MTWHGQFRPRPPGGWQLNPGEAHVWRIPLEAACTNLPSVPDILAPGEIERANRYRFEKDRRRFSACRTALRLILGRYLDCPSTAIRFATSPRGKPFLDPAAHGQPLCFNVSHSHELALCAFMHDQPVGVDLEHHRRVSEMDRIVDRFFSPGERAWFQSMSGPDRAALFFRIWTRKEACLKAMGYGIDDHVEQLDVSICPGLPARWEQNHGAADPTVHWHITDLAADEDYSAALASADSEPSIQCWLWDWDACQAAPGFSRGSPSMDGSPSNPSDYGLMRRTTR